MSGEQKQCTKCRKWKDLSEFTRKFKIINRLHPQCNECRKEWQKDYYEKHKEEQRETRKQRQIDSREVARHYVFTYLQSNPCVDCGNSDPYVLTFDHVRGNKKMNVSQMVNQGYSIAQIQAEIDKCVVRCANCHMREEKKRRGTKYWLF